MIILLPLFYLLNICKTPKPLRTPLYLLYCVALVILYKMKSDHIFTTKQFLLLLHNKHDYSRKNQLCRKCWQQVSASQPKLAPPRHQTGNVGYKNISIDDWKQPLMGWLNPSELSGERYRRRKLDSGLGTTVGDWNQTNAFSISKKYAKINTEQTLPCASNFSQMSVVIENYFSVQSGGHPWVQLECCHSADIKEFHIERRKKKF